jgi:hypothetical protein
MPNMYDEKKKHETFWKINYTQVWVFCFPKWLVSLYVLYAILRIHYEFGWKFLYQKEVMVMLGATCFYDIFNMHLLYIISGLHLWNMVDEYSNNTN